MSKYLLALLFVAQGAFAQNLDGTWVKDCTKDPHGGSLLQSVVIQGQHLDFSMIHHADANCKAELFRFSWSADFVLSKPIADSVYEIDFTLLALNAVFADAQAAAQFSSPQIQFCGYTDWKVGEVKNVAGRVCSGNQLANIGYKAFNTIRVEPGYIAIDFNGSLPEIAKRPAGDWSSIFVRQ
ncbi:hypothetical protein K2X30_04025 [bacterium]|nr:hypothetical protein [bacterium]